MAPPPVVGVSRAMPDSIQGISHVPELISSYLLPHTIDAAVYNGLHRVIQVYGASRPLTDAAMDGAATRGRLSIVQWLSSGRRRSGCSEAAFTGAASNGHLRVLKWLIQYSPKEYHFTQCLTAAAGAGQLAVVQFQRSQRRIYDKIPPFIAAAANGHVDVLKALGPWPFDIYRAVNAAVANGQVLGMYCAAQNGRTDLVNLLMSTCEFDSGSIMRAVTDGAENDHCAVVKLLMDHFTLGKPNVSTDVVPMMQGVISIACRSAAERGNAEMVKILAVKCSSELIGLVLKETTKAGNHELVKLLLHECEARNLEDSWYHLRIGMMVQNAVSRGDVEMAKLLVEKCDPTDVGRSLKIAVENNSADMLHLLAPMTGVYIKEDPYIVAALVQAARKDQVAMVDILVQYSDEPTVEEAILQLSSNGDIAATKLLLEKCDIVSTKHLFVKATEKDVVELVEILLEQMDTSCIRWALMTASANGYIGTVKSMLHKCDSTSIGCALEVAVHKRELAVVDVLRERCDLTSICDAIASAKSNGHTDVVQLLDSKRPRLT